MKYLLIIGVLGLAVACEREAGPTATEPRAVNGVVEVRLGAVTERYDLRVDHVSGGFVPLLRPVGHAGKLAAPVAGLPFVVAGEPPAKPITIPTPRGDVIADLVYRPLGPWQVLDRAELRMQGIPALTFAVRDARLEH